MDSLQPEENLFGAALRWPEVGAAERLGETLHIGVKCKILRRRLDRRVPRYPRPRKMISFGLAGGIARGLKIGEVVEATVVVDEFGNELGKCRRFNYPGAREVIVLASKRFIFSAEERYRLCKQSRADIVDMETGPLLEDGLLDSHLRVISDTPEEPVNVCEFIKSLKNSSEAVKKLWSL
jgi:nucleoside phosphorylase